MLAALRQELEQIDEAILVMERIARGAGKRRGRPPAWLKREDPETAAAPAGPAKRRGRPPGSKNKPSAEA